MDQIGRIRIEREIGRGGMGVVYKGYDPFLERAVAVKSLVAAGIPGQQWAVSVKRLELEARAAARLNHPNIVAVYDVLPSADSFCVVMEFVEGQTLDAAAPEGVFAPPEFVTQVIRECAAGLDHAHSRGVIHRDIKPSNIMLDQSGTAKIADFGIAKLSDSTAELTQGQAIGTFSYMSAEQLTGQLVDGRSDQYSLAVVACRLLTGTRQRQGSPSALNEKLNPQVDRVLDRAMSLLPEKRYESCSAFAQDLAGALAGGVPAAPKRTRRAAWIVASAAVLLTAGVGFFLARGGNHAPVQSAPAAGQTAPVVAEKSPTPTPDVATAGNSKAAEPPVQVAATAVPRPNPLSNSVPKSAPNPTKLPDPAKPAAPEQPRVGSGESRVNPKDGLPYVWIPPGKFSMGCSGMDAECNQDEKPVHQVTLTNGFWIGKTEVTQDAFQRVRGNNPSYQQGAGLPVERVPWNAARGYCAAVGMRLPTEAEWEFAARGGDLSSRYGALNAVAWFLGDSEKQTHKVGEKRANGYGLYDTLGNLWEWVADWYGSYSAEPMTDPQGPVNGDMRVVRGAGWNTLRKNVRVSIRDKEAPAYRHSTIGFRCAGGSL